MPEPLADGDGDELGEHWRSILTGPLKTLLESHLAATDCISEIRAGHGKKALSEAIDRLTAEYTEGFLRLVASELYRKYKAPGEPQNFLLPAKEPLSVAPLPTKQLSSTTQSLPTTKETTNLASGSLSINQNIILEGGHKRDTSKTINRVDSGVSNISLSPSIPNDESSSGNGGRKKDLSNTTLHSKPEVVSIKDSRDYGKDTSSIFTKFMKFSWGRKPSVDTNPTTSRASSVTEEHPLTNTDVTSEYSEERPLTISSATSNYARPAPAPPPPAEYAKYTSEFITKNLGGLYDPKSPKVQQILKTAATKAKEIMEKYELSPDLSLGLTKLALYDFVILCDDSTSMQRENRIGALKSTLKRVAEIANLIEPSGISIRFLNYRHDSSFNNLFNMNAISPKIDNVRFRGITQLGTILDSKIVQPMIMRKIEARTFRKPLIVVMITDGEPYGEDKNRLEQVIRSCKTSETLKRFGEAAVIFIISRVGSSEEAKDFLNELHNDEELKDWVYCSMDRLDEESAVMQRVSKDIEYTKKASSLIASSRGLLRR